MDEENVWNYPRPPKMEEVDHHIVIEFGGETIAESRQTLRFLETSHPPTYYMPPEHCLMTALKTFGKHSLCEWKGQAHYYDLFVDDRVARAAAWAYANPVAAFRHCRDYVAFYPSRVDACFVNGERVQSQDGDFYGGWITKNLKGPFKGAPGTMGW